MGARATFAMATALVRMCRSLVVAIALARPRTGVTSRAAPIRSRRRLVLNRICLCGGVLLAVCRAIVRNRGGQGTLRLATLCRDFDIHTVCRLIEGHRQRAELTMRHGDGRRFREIHLAGSHDLFDHAFDIGERVAYDRARGDCHRTQRG